MRALIQSARRPIAIDSMREFEPGVSPNSLFCARTELSSSRIVPSVRRPSIVRENQATVPPGISRPSSFVFFANWRHCDPRRGPPATTRRLSAARRSGPSPRPANPKLCARPGSASSGGPERRRDTSARGPAMVASTDSRWRSRLLLEVELARAVPIAIRNTRRCPCASIRRRLPTARILRGSPACADCECDGDCPSGRRTAHRACKCDRAAPECIPWR